MVCAICISRLTQLNLCAKVTPMTTSRYIGSASDRVFVRPTKVEAMKAWDVYVGMIGNGNTRVGQIVKAGEGFVLVPVVATHPSDLVNRGRLDESRSCHVYSPNLANAVSALRAL